MKHIKKFNEMNIWENLELKKQEGDKDLNLEQNVYLKLKYTKLEKCIK